MTKKFLTFLGILAICVFGWAVMVMADTVDISVDSSDGYDASVLTDDDYYTGDYYGEGVVLTVTSSTPMDYLYIMWNSVPGEWTLTVNGQSTTCGQNDFLHELVKLPSSATEAKITLSAEQTSVCDIYGISGEIPSWVQQWETPYDEADMLIISTHSDDEILFLGAAMATYNNGGEYRVQIAYMCDLSLTEVYRQHEQLNGLWAMGITHYPQMGKFVDEWPDDEDLIYDIVDYDELVEYMVETIRRFKPQVTVTHDFDGEYGHPEHKMCAAAVAEALESTGDSTKYTDSVTKYGTWDVPKAYFHLYEENQIELNCRVPLSDYGGQTAVEVAKAAYKEHQSQQWMWFYVSDGYDDDGNVDYSDDRISQINCSLFGLYRTNVGADTSNDMMEHIVSYDEQEKAKEQETATEAATETVVTTVTDETGGTVETVITVPASTETETTEAESVKGAGTAQVVKTILIIAAVIIGILIILIIVLLIAAHIKRKKEAERRRRRRLAAQRRRAQQGQAGSSGGTQRRSQTGQNRTQTRNRK